jgi:hypothetical protein
MFFSHHDCMTTIHNYSGGSVKGKEETEGGEQELQPEMGQEKMREEKL